MIAHEVAQNSAEWWRLRLGMPTASSFSKIIKSTPTWLCITADGEVASRHTERRTAQAAADKLAKKNGGEYRADFIYEPSTQADAYLHRLIGEWLSGTTSDDYQSRWMERGHELEPEAWKYYEMLRDVDVVRGGFVTDIRERVGCSPDGRVYEDDLLVGGIELKCPMPETQAAYLLGGKDVAAQYRHQIQGCMLLTGAKWWDILSYHPLMPPAIVRVERDSDPEYLAALRGAVFAFADRLDAARASLLAQGYEPRAFNPTYGDETE